MMIDERLGILEIRIYAQILDQYIGLFLYREVNVLVDLHKSQSAVIYSIGGATGKMYRKINAIDNILSH